MPAAFAVEDIDAITAVVGARTRFLDPEGNDIGAMKYETPPRT